MPTLSTGGSRQVQHVHPAGRGRGEEGPEPRRRRNEEAAEDPQKRRLESHGREVLRRQGIGVIKLDGLSVVFWSKTICLSLLLLFFITSRQFCLL